MAGAELTYALLCLVFFYLSGKTEKGSIIQWVLLLMGFGFCLVAVAEVSETAEMGLPGQLVGQAGFFVFMGVTLIKVIITLLDKLIKPD